MILLRNRTGPRTGAQIRYEYGSDLFGYWYLDIVRTRKHRATSVRRLVFDNPRDFICLLDLDLDRKETLNYFPVDELMSGSSAG
ncbi:MAG: hypothetical protein H7A21_19510 [Spirochaetales bacterium]|nr:hypothetical protein [Leptospiraceae bacterium]MCP5483634.1 hypothetical protein [Spirochaetales bacterium]MCP5484501.1 hypothetical protein [Spirochaetales bacterium]